ncbi:tetratricopeptide repeat protein [Aeoliella mucimassa]|uniref:Tetratricopeptide repeat protein n=1 Tax=Aeoliella mucimassa TaxID=2527972 RepID=A0A518AL15_9BACT|nr:hypothetical protein [Aeoliella mucimassa]QDU55374.1 hypothetical protein Pan181_15630 [Aeoliella mucimassa]
MLRTWSLAILCSFSMLAVLGCGGDPALESDGNASADESAVETNSAAAPREREVRPVAARMVTTEEAQQFADKMKQAYDDNDTRTFDGMIDWDTMAMRATAGLDLSESDRTEVMNGLQVGMRSVGSFVTQIRRGGGNTADYQLVNILEKDGNRVVIFRASGDNGVNYHQYTLQRVDGQLKAVDLYVFLTGETITETWRRGLLPHVAEMNKNWLQRATSKESAYVQSIDKVSQFQNLVLSGQSDAQAWNLFYSLPEEVRFSKGMLIQAYALSNRTGEDKIMEISNAIRTHHSDATGLELMLIDSLLIAEKYDEALQALDAVDQAVGGDPYVDALRGNTYLLQENYPKAMEYFDKVMETGLDMDTAFYGTVAAGLPLKEFTKVAAAMETLEERYGVVWGDLRSLAEYREFLESPEGQYWMETHNY